MKRPEKPRRPRYSIPDRFGIPTGPFAAVPIPFFEAFKELGLDCTCLVVAVAILDVWRPENGNTFELHASRLERYADLSREGIRQTIWKLADAGVLGVFSEPRKSLVIDVTPLLSVIARRAKTGSAKHALQMQPVDLPSGVGSPAKYSRQSAKRQARPAGSSRVPEEESRGTPSPPPDAGSVVQVDESDPENGHGGIPDDVRSDLVQQGLATPKIRTFTDAERAAHAKRVLEQAKALDAELPKDASA